MRKPKKPPVRAKGGGPKARHPHHPVPHGTPGGQGAPGAHHHHHKPAPVKKPKPPKKRHWSPGWDADCCVAEAVGRILGLSDSDVLELDAAADRTIAGVLEVAGLRRGSRPAGSAPPDTGAALILGVALPQPHAIAVIDGIWWSWGQPFNPDDWPQLVIEEAWELCAG